MSENSQEDYDIEYERIRKRFPEAKFSICMSQHEDTILTTEETIFLKISYGCYCYQGKFPPLYIRVKKIKPEGISIADCIDEIIKSKKNTEEMCNHSFLEIIKQIKETITYECWFGS